MSSRLALGIIDFETVFLVGAVLSVVAILYSSVGHGGASGYIAVLALFGFAPEIIRPAALCLNVFVAGLATIRFARAGLVNWRTAIPILACSVPCAFLGGTVILATDAYRLLLGVLLVLSAVYLIWQSTRRDERFANMQKAVPVASSIATGSSIGLAIHRLSSKTRLIAVTRRKLPSKSEPMEDWTNSLTKSGL